VETLRLPLRGSRGAQRSGGGPTLSNDVLNDAFKVPKDILSSHANCPHTLPRQPTIASSVMRRFKIVAQIIDFNAKLRAVTVEVQHIRTGRVLVPKAQPCFLFTQRPPQESLRQRHFGTQLTGASDRVFGASELQRPLRQPCGLTPPPSGEELL